MESVWGYVDGRVKYNKLSNAPNPPFDHYDLQDIGVNTHAQIDAHIANDTNPHGTTVTIDDLQVGTILEGAATSGVTFHSAPAGPNIKAGVITPVTDTVITLPDGIDFGTSSTLLTQFFADYQSSVAPTTHPWGSAQSVDLYFVKMGPYCEMSIATYGLAATTSASVIVFTAVVPTIMRPASDITASIPIVTGNGTSERRGGITIHSSGDLTIGINLSLSPFPTGGTLSGIIPAIASWAV